MHLFEPNYEHFVEMASWVLSQEQLHEWAGPSVRYPCSAATLMSDFKLDELISFSLLDDDNNLVAFGQCYERVDCCHLGRLIVAPDFRGKAIVASLIERLSLKGCDQFNTNVCSLFVLKKNDTAIKAYQKIGFKLNKYPHEMPLESCLYMTKKLISSVR